MTIKGKQTKINGSPKKTLRSFSHVQKSKKKNQTITITTQPPHSRSLCHSTLSPRILNCLQHKKMSKPKRKNEVKKPSRNGNILFSLDKHSPSKPKNLQNSRLSVEMFKSRKVLQLSSQKMHWSQEFPADFKRLNLMIQESRWVLWQGKDNKGAKVCVKQFKLQDSCSSKQYQLLKDNKKKSGLIKILSKCQTLTFSWLILQHFYCTLRECIFNQDQLNPYYYKLVARPNLIKKIARSLIKAVGQINQKGYVHCHLSLQTLTLKQQNFILWDLSQATLYDKISASQISAIRAPPQLINLFAYQSKKQCFLRLVQYLNDYNQPHLIDVWGIGLVLLEIKTGKLIDKQGGLLYLPVDDNFELIKRQMKVIYQLQTYLSDTQQRLKYFIKRCLSMDPKLRLGLRQLNQLIRQ